MKLKAPDLSLGSIMMQRQLQFLVGALLLCTGTAMAQAPVNDDCSSPLPALLGITSIDSTNATGSNTLVGTSCGFVSWFMVNDIFYTFTPVTTDCYDIEVRDNGSGSWDSRLAIYNTLTCPTTVSDLVACDDDDGAGNMAFMQSVPLTSGTTYLIRIGSWNTSVTPQPSDLSISVCPPTPLVSNTFSYTGIVDAVASGGSPDSASFQAFAGEPISVTFTYDLGTPDNNASANGDYLGAVIDLEVTVGANVYTDIAGGDVIITNNGVNPDQFRVSSFVTGPAVAGISETIQLRLTFSDSTNTVFSSDALPLTQPDPDDFDLGAQINLQFADVINLCDFGNIITNAVACDPDCLTLLGSDATVTRSQTLPVIDFGPLSFGLAVLPSQLDVTIEVGPGFPTGGGSVGYGLSEVLSANVVIGDGVFTQLMAFDMEVEADGSIEALSATFAPLNTPMVSAGSIVLNSPASITGTDIASGLAFSYTYGVSTDVIEFNIIADIVFTSLCSGDGGNQLGCTDCPCMNNAAPSTVGGCLNSAGTGIQLLPSGSPSVSLLSGDTTDLRFGADGAPANAFCILNSGDAVAPGNMANPCFGMNSGAQAAAFDGLRCAIKNTRRHGGRSADGNGDVGITNNPWGGEGGPPVGLAVAGAGFLAGQTRFFQVINRDDPLLACMRGLNTSQAVEVTFTP